MTSVKVEDREHLIGTVSLIPYCFIQKLQQTNRRWINIYFCTIYSKIVMKKLRYKPVSYWLFHYKMTDKPPNRVIFGFVADVR